MSIFGNVLIERKTEIVESIVEIWGRCGKQNTVPVSGRSMLPFLKTGDQLKVLHGQSHTGVGDVITFYKNDTFVAHRVMQIKVEQNKTLIITKGDNSPQFDSPLSLQEIVGRVIAVKRNGRLMEIDTLSWKVMGKLIVAKTHVQGKMVEMCSLVYKGNFIKWRYQISNFILRAIYFALKVLIKAIRPCAYQFKH